MIGFWYMYFVDGDVRPSDVKLEPFQFFTWRLHRMAYRNASGASTLSQRFFLVNTNAVGETRDMLSPPDTIDGIANIRHIHG